MGAILIIFLLVMRLISQCFAVGCKTCEGQECLKKDVKYRMCTKLSSIVPPEAYLMLPKIIENVQYGCLKLEYPHGEQGSLFTVQKCIITQDIDSVCPEIAKRIPYTTCSVHLPSESDQFSNVDHETAELTPEELFESQSTVLPIEETEEELINSNIDTSDKSTSSYGSQMESSTDFQSLDEAISTNDNYDEEHSEQEILELHSTDSWEILMDIFASENEASSPDTLVTTPPSHQLNDFEMNTDGSSESVTQDVDSENLEGDNFDAQNQQENIEGDKNGEDSENEATPILSFETTVLPDHSTDSWELLTDSFGSENETSSPNTLLTTAPSDHLNDFEMITEGSSESVTQDADSENLEDDNFVAQNQQENIEGDKNGEDSENEATSILGFETTVLPDHSTDSWELLTDIFGSENETSSPDTLLTTAPSDQLNDFEMITEGSSESVTQDADSENLEDDNFDAQNQQENIEGDKNGEDSENEATPILGFETTVLPDHSTDSWELLTDIFANENDASSPDTLVTTPPSHQLNDFEMITDGSSQSVTQNVDSENHEDDNSDAQNQQENIEGDKNSDDSENESTSMLAFESTVLPDDPTDSWEILTDIFSSDNETSFPETLLTTAPSDQLNDFEMITDGSSESVTQDDDSENLEDDNFDAQNQLENIEGDKNGEDSENEATPILGFETTVLSDHSTDSWELLTDIFGSENEASSREILLTTAPSHQLNDLEIITNGIPDSETQDFDSENHQSNDISVATDSTSSTTQETYTLIDGIETTKLSDHLLDVQAVETSIAEEHSETATNSLIFENESSDETTDEPKDEGVDSEANNNDFQDPSEIQEVFDLDLVTQPNNFTTNPAENSTTSGVAGDGIIEEDLKPDNSSTEKEFNAMTTSPSDRETKQSTPKPDGHLSTNAVDPIEAEDVFMLSTLSASDLSITTIGSTSSKENAFETSSTEPSDPASSSSTTDRTTVKNEETTVEPVVQTEPPILLDTQNASTQCFLYSPILCSILFLINSFLK